MSETQSGVTFTNGVFDVQIGASTPIPSTLNFAKTYYLGVAFDGGAEITPRSPLTYVMNAMHAKVADGLSATATGAVTSVNNKSGALTLVGAGGTTINQTGSTITISSSGSGGTGVQGMQCADGSLSVISPNGPVSTLGVAVGGVSTVKIADAAVTTQKIADGAITLPKLSTVGAVAGQALIYNGTSAVWAQSALGAGSFTTLSSSGNTTLGITAGTINAFGNGLAANNSIGSGGGSTVNSFGVSAATNDFGGNGGTNSFGVGATTNVMGTAGTSTNSILGTTFLNQNSSSNTSINTGAGSGMVSIGNTSSTTTMLGTTNINASGAGSTNVGTGTGQTTIGNSVGITSITGSGWNVNAGGLATFSGLMNNGNSNLSTESDATGGGNLVTITGTKSVAIVTGTSTGTITANVVGAPTTGQQLIICNKSGSGFSVLFAGATIGVNSASMFVFVGGGWVWVH